MKPKEKDATKSAPRFRNLHLSFSETKTHLSVQLDRLRDVPNHLRTREIVLLPTSDVVDLEESNLACSRRREGDQLGEVVSEVVDRVGLWEKEGEGALQRRGKKEKERKVRFEYVEDEEKGENEPRPC